VVYETLNEPANLAGHRLYRPRVYGAGVSQGSEVSFAFVFIAQKGSDFILGYKDLNRSAAAVEKVGVKAVIKLLTVAVCHGISY